MGKGSVLGAAVGVALENQQAIRETGAPVVNAAGGVVQVIFNTFWKSIVTGIGLMVVWMAAFAFTYIFTASNFFGRPAFMFSFGIFVFLILPVIVGIREARRVKRKVVAKNIAHRQAIRDMEDAKHAEYMQQVAHWQAQVPQGYQLPPQPQFPPAFNRIRQ